jgi:hypothetical protein
MRLPKNAFIGTTHGSLRQQTGSKFLFMFLHGTRSLNTVLSIILNDYPGCYLVL